MRLTYTTTIEYGNNKDNHLEHFVFTMDLIQDIVTDATVIVDKVIVPPSIIVEIPSAKELYDMYWNQMLNLKTIGDKYGVHGSKVGKWMVTYGIPRRPVGYYKPGNKG